MSRAVKRTKSIPPEYADWARAHSGQNCPIDPNPMVRAYGLGPEGKRCEGCAHIFRRKFSNTYFKCRLRGVPTAGPGTDHRARWNACKRFEARQ